jgi:hypothetical protein
VNKKEWADHELRMTKYQLSKDYLGEVGRLQKEFGAHEKQLTEAASELRISFLRALAY